MEHGQGVKEVEEVQGLREVKEVGEVEGIREVKEVNEVMRFKGFER